MVLARIERHGVGRASFRVAVPGIVVGLAIGLFGPFDRRARDVIPAQRTPR
jgi:hypothetical protein